MLPPQDFLPSVEISPVRVSYCKLQTLPSSLKENVRTVSTITSSIPSLVYSNVAIRTSADCAPLDLTTGAKKIPRHPMLTRKNPDRCRLGSAGEGSGSPLMRRGEKRSQIPLVAKRLTWARKRLLHVKRIAVKGGAREERKHGSSEVNVGRNFSNWRPWLEEGNDIHDSRESVFSSDMDVEEASTESCERDRRSNDSSCSDTLLNYNNSSNTCEKLCDNDSEGRERQCHQVVHSPVSLLTSYRHSPAHNDVTPEHNSLPLPLDPRQWSRLDVANWLLHMRDLYNIPDLDLQRFHMNGKALCLMIMKPEMFTSRVPSHGLTLYQDFSSRLQYFVSSPAFVPCS